MEQTLKQQTPRRLAWYLWPLVVLVLPITFILMLPLLVLAAFSIPYFALYPDRHAHVYDIRGTPQQRERLAQWRAAYRRLGLSGRFQRVVTLWRRRTRRH